MDIVHQSATDTADSFAIELDRKVSRGPLVRLTYRYPFLRPGLGVGMGKDITQVEPDFAIIGVVNERRNVGAAPGPQFDLFGAAHL